MFSGQETPPSAPSGTAFARAMEALTPDVMRGRPDLRPAAALISQGQLDGASQVLQQFVREHPEDESAWFLAGDIARRRERFSEAETLFARAVDLAPNFEAARFHLANVLLEIGKPGAALIRAEQLLQVKPKNLVFRGLKAMALELMDEHAAAAASNTAQTSGEIDEANERVCIARAYCKGGLGASNLSPGGPANGCRAATSGSRSRGSP